ncbi:MAG: DUF4215 domain-containing protein [Deltaproteobacteria bacterium]
MSQHSKLTIVSIALLFAACGEADTQPVGSAYLAKQLVRAGNGGTLQVSADAPATFAGARLEVPANALAEDTVLTMAPGGSDVLVDDATSAGPAIAFGPAGTTFTTPARVVLPYVGGVTPELIRVYVLEDDGTRSMILPDAITVDEEAGTLTFEVEHFTQFQGGSAGNPCAGVMCPQGQTCQQGQCAPASCGVGCACSTSADCDRALVCTAGACAAPPCTAVGCACASNADCATGLVCSAAGQCATPPPPPPVCGNGVVESGEQCDDGNTTNGDGCDDMCQTEMPPGCTVQVMSGPLPNGTVGVRYAGRLPATGALGGAATWTIISGTLPAGLGLDMATGDIFGVPTTAGNSSFVAEASVPNCTPGTGQFLITVQ